MELTFVKRDGKSDDLTIRREDGSIETISCPKQGIIPHDMIHYAVESTLAHRGFLSLVRAEFDLYESVGGTQAGIFVIHHDDRRGGRRSCRKLCPLIFAAVFWLLFREARATVLLRRDLV